MLNVVVLGAVELAVLETAEDLVLEMLGLAVLEPVELTALLLLLAVFEPVELAVLLAIDEDLLIGQEDPSRFEPAAHGIQSSCPIRRPWVQTWYAL